MKIIKEKGVNYVRVTRKGFFRTTCKTKFKRSRLERSAVGFIKELFQDKYDQKIIN